MQVLTKVACTEAKPIKGLIINIMQRALWLGEYVDNVDTYGIDFIATYIRT